MDKSLLLAAATLVFCGAAFAQTSPARAPGAPDTTAPTGQLWTDKNGDGVIQHDEVAPGSQLEKRFETRDKNHDGQLTSDEYYLPH